MSIEEGDAFDPLFTAEGAANRAALKSFKIPKLPPSSALLTNEECSKVDQADGGMNREGDNKSTADHCFTVLSSH